MSDILLREITGSNFDRMPPAVKRMHSIGKSQDVHGISRVMGGHNWLGKIIRIIAALPKKAWRAPIFIRFVKHEKSEEWNRMFGKNKFETVMSQEKTYLAERMKALPVTFVYRVDAGEKGFVLNVMKIRFFGIPLPRLLRPYVVARATEWRGRYRFSTVVGFWFCGRVISYFGYLDPPKP